MAHETSEERIVMSITLYPAYMHCETVSFMRQCPWDLGSALAESTGQGEVGGWCTRRLHLGLAVNTCSPVQRMAVCSVVKILRIKKYISALLRNYVLLGRWHRLMRPNCCLFSGLLVKSIAGHYQPQIR